MSDHGDLPYDMIVLGGGAVGSHIAEACVEAGMSVALVEKDQLGGTCLNYGCDPMNKMIRAGEVMRLARSASRFGIQLGDVQLDWPVLRGQIASMIDEIRGGDGIREVEEKGIHLVQGHASFISPHEIAIGDQVFAGKQFVIATGSETQATHIPGIDDIGFLVNTDMFSLDELPGSLVILGENSIAIEFAQTYLNFGLNVTVVTPEARILPIEEIEVVDELTSVLKDDGLRLHTGSVVTRADSTSTGRKRLEISSADGGKAEIEADAILVATERAPRIDGLGLDAAGVVASERGIAVDATMRTSVPHIWAVGDVTGTYAYTHTANYQGEIALDHILNPGSEREADYRVVPWKVFTQPELARVGLTEAEARAAGYDVVVSTMPYRDQPRAITLDERAGLVKLVVDRSTHEVLGCHVLGAYASEVIAQVALVMQHRLPVSAICETIHTHPTMAEAVYWAAKSLMDGPLGS